MKESFEKIVKSLLEHWIITLLSSGGIVVAFFGWIYRTYLKGWLATKHSLELHGLIFILVFLAIAGLPILLFILVKKKPNRYLLTDADDIFNKLYWWLGQQREFVQKQTEDNKVVTWHFSVIDKELGLNPGSAEKVLPKMLNKSPKLFPFTLLKKGKKTIALRYGL